MFERMKKKWNIESTFDLVVIMLVFSLAGMAILFERRPIFYLLGITSATAFWIQFLAWLAVVFPSYQLNLIVFGTLLGKFRFFWEKEKKILRFLGRLLEVETKIWK